MRFPSPILFAVVASIGHTLAASNTAWAVENQWRSIPGPVSVQVIRIIDGDTLEVDAHPWPGHAVRVSVRLRGIDTPERRSRCSTERLAADHARNELERLVSGFPTVELINVSGGKYYGRVLADLKAGTRDVAAAMLESGLARPYQGGKRLKAVCGTSGK
ncbi:micrococcal nuclease-like nuclease [Hoeflea sp. IMCC20628]|uniref:thermonuclease family protein n=1 Tax=Hoeflea sp. IMCC20628 TaxID=1620421 RepID=UPI00063AACB9|nr:thermonuclease family protein [Hoeflea sp. IMCC20628]AKI02921.1 micrococcal nuclease-like nuclease [Hoeflea sp. IMCC20628]